MWEYIGQEQIFNYLNKARLNNNLAHFYIFQGQKFLGKKSAAFYFAKSLFCEKGKKEPCLKCKQCIQIDKGIHPDIFYLEKQQEAKDITINDIKILKDKLDNKPFFNKWKIAIIEEAENLNIKAANAMLKTLEEPKGDAIIILLVNDLSKIPATIISRSQILYFNLVDFKKIYNWLIEKFNLKRDQAREITHLSKGRPRLAKIFATEEEYLAEYKKITYDFLNLFDNSVEINQKFQYLDSLILNKKSFNEKIALSKDLIDKWQTIIRDIFLYKIGSQDRIINYHLRGKIANLEINPKKIVELWQETSNYKNYFLEQNIDVKLLLENLLLKI